MSTNMGNKASQNNQEEKKEVPEIDWRCTLCDYFICDKFQCKIFTLDKRMPKRNGNDKTN